LVIGRCTTRESSRSERQILHVRRTFYQLEAIAVWVHEFGNPPSPEWFVRIGREFYSSLNKDTVGGTAVLGEDYDASPRTNPFAHLVGTAVRSGNVRRKQNEFGIPRARCYRQPPNVAANGDIKDHTVLQLVAIEFKRSLLVAYEYRHAPHSKLHRVRARGRIKSFARLLAREHF
jgi:hypothetical protein